METENWEKNYQGVVGHLYTAQEEIDKLQSRNMELETELQDIKDSYNKVMEENCPTDEVHCTCVPALRASRTKLEAEVEALEASRDDWHKIADSRSAEIIRLKSENAELKKQLEETQFKLLVAESIVH